MKDIIQKEPTLNQTNIEISSAGTGTTNGRQAHPYAQKVMEDWGLSLAQHLTSPISKQIVDRADLIVAMDRDVAKDIIDAYPESSGKMCILEITDPYGHLEEVFRRCAQDIRDGCVSIVLPLVKSLL